jgi:formamidopyrimidine-DNA glycosylase
MPELPDLHVFSRNLHRRLVGSSIRDVSIWRTRRRNFSAAKLRNAIQDQALRELRREGKEIHFRFANGRRLAVHLMLCGQFDVTSDPNSIKYARLGLAFKSGEWLMISDPRGLVTFTLDPRPETVPDALSADLSQEYLRDQLRRSGNIPIKCFLVDQTLLRGIGNAYADEILWASRIAPQSQCNRLPENTIIDLHQAIRSVLTDAIMQIERLAPNAINGEIRDFLKVHHPERSQCPDGHPIHCEMVGLKKSYFCESQIIYD